MAASSGGSDDKSELLMDETEAEEITESILLPHMVLKSLEETATATTTLTTATPKPYASAPSLHDAVPDTGDAQRGEQQDNNAYESSDNALTDVAGASASGSATGGGRRLRRNGKSRSVAFQGDSWQEEAAGLEFHEQAFSLT